MSGRKSRFSLELSYRTGKHAIIKVEVLSNAQEVKARHA